MGKKFLDSMQLHELNRVQLGRLIDRCFVIKIRFVQCSIFDIKSMARFVMWITSFLYTFVKAETASGLKLSLVKGSSEFAKHSVTSTKIFFYVNFL